MNKRFLLPTAVAAFANAWLACSSPTNIERLGLTHEALDATKGTIPYPAKTKEQNPVYDERGRIVPGWNGSVVDLLAADAWAQCGAHTSSAADSDRAHDAYTTYLEGRMSWPSCAAAGGSGSEGFTIRDCAVGACAPMKRWATQRQVPACNGDPATGYARSVQFLPNSSIGITVPPAATLGITATTSVMADDAIANAQKWVDVAEVNLCMAQRLRDQMNTADSLLLDGAEQRQLLAVIRERAQIAMVQYGLIARATTNPDTRTATITHAKQSIQVFQAWGAYSGATTALTTIGKDLAASVSLHVQVSREFAELLSRTASARAPRGGIARSMGEEAWGAGGWRQRLLSLLYGGNPLRKDRGELDPSNVGPIALDSWWEARGVVPWPTAWMGSEEDESFPNAMPGVAHQPYVETSIRDPRVLSLFALARENDALHLRTKANDRTLTLMGVSRTLPGTALDLDDSAEKIWLAVEASLRTADCIARTGDTTCVVAINDPVVPRTTEHEKSLLFAKHGITPAHARLLVQVLAEALPRSGLREADALLTLTGLGSGGSAEWLEGGMHATGAHRTLTSTELATRLPGAAGTWILFAKNGAFAPWRIDERAAAHAELANHFVPRNFDKLAPAEHQGFRVDALRRLGAVSARAGERDLIEDALSSATTSLQSSVLGVSGPAIQLIDAAIGGSGLSLRPRAGAKALVDECGEFGTTSCTRVVQLGDAVSGASTDWDVTMRGALSDTLLSDDAVTLVAVPAGRLEVSAALDPDFKAPDGKTRAAYLETGAVTATSIAKSVTPTVVRREFKLVIPTSVTDYAAKTRNLRWSLFLRKSELTGPATYRTVAANVAFAVDGAERKVTETVRAPVFFPVAGQWLAFGGALGTMAQRAWLTRGGDWSRPAFDGFGLPTSLIPPTDPALSPAGTLDVVAGSLRSAKTTAAAATQAVEDAVATLLQQQIDDGVLAAAKKKGSEVEKIELRGLCGDGPGSCDVELVAADTDPFWAWIIPLGAGELTSAASRAQARMRPRAILLARPVYEHRADASAPTFGDYAGGRLQLALLEQWRAYHAILSIYRDGREAVAAKDAAVAAARAAIVATRGRYEYQCSKERLFIADGAGYSIDDQPAAARYTGDFVLGCQAKVGYSIAPIVEAWNACLAAERAVGPTEAQHAATIAHGWAWAAAHASAISDAWASLARSTADLQAIVADSRLAQARSVLETNLADAGLQTKLGTYRRLHSYDTWRARALIDSARREALFARRTIESTFAVDLSTLHDSEQFVTAPSTWSDDVYSYDLDAPATVGLATTAGGGGINPNRLLDYVGNLERFVDGFASRRGISVSDHDVEVLTIPGPDSRFGTLLSGSSSRWDFRCSVGSDEWRPHPGYSSTASIPTMCSGNPPTRARVTFALDAWGGLEGDDSPPRSDRANVRWVRLALNVAGTGVRDCERAADPLQCKSESFVRWSLRHVGPSWVPDADGAFQLLDVPVGQIEGAKGIAAERWLESVGAAWELPWVDSVARLEFASRPVFGTYQLEMDVPPDVRLERISRLQLLAHTTSWSRSKGKS